MNAQNLLMDKMRLIVAERTRQIVTYRHERMDMLSSAHSAVTHQGINFIAPTAHDAEAYCFLVEKEIFESALKKLTLCKRNSIALENVHCNRNKKEANKETQRYGGNTEQINVYCD
ncbi:unnamed protein product [Anisakis simplex]|uniref:Uncharacterized protein n=1 Tax=Anisakis simplex TaxID=6269 RepID=A0A0M3JR65_ANISI|nr:unnamed protein product [Anisakis simplex]